MTLTLNKNGLIFTLKFANTILFPARLVDNSKIVIEDDNFEEGLTYSLIKAGIKKEDIIFR